MKVIQITDDDAKALLADLELAKWRDPTWTSPEAAKLDEATRKQLSADMHRAFHYHVVRWLQHHGANVTS